MSSYRRPPLAEPVYFDASGSVIEYGSRWGPDGPPEDTYSVVSHPERFAALHLVADALIEYLADNYDVRVSHDPAHAADLVRSRDDVTRVTRLTPAQPDCATLTVAYTSHPAVIVHAGLLHDFVYPSCGCDACDENTTGCAEQLEWHVQAVALGRYREEYDRDGDLPVTFSIAAADGNRTQGGRSLAGDYPRSRLSGARKRLAQLADGWAAWPLRNV
jgi:Family of unknown function (DUF6226)